MPTKIPRDTPLDQVDRALLRALARDARATGSALATALGVAESTVSLRLRRLRSDGYIRGYRADLDLVAVGATLQALVSVRLGKHNRRDIDAFRTAAPHWPGVLAVFHMAGANDYLLHVAARDADELREFVLTFITGHPSVEHTETNLIFERVDGTGWEQLVGVASADTAGRRTTTGS